MTRFLTWLVVSAFLQYIAYSFFGWPPVGMLGWIGAIFVALLGLAAAWDITLWIFHAAGSVPAEEAVEPRHLTMTPVELYPLLEAAACRYAAMSPSDFVNDTLTVSSTKLRNLGMIDTETWARVPAGGDVRVTRDASDTLTARVMLPWQPKNDGPGLSVKHAYQSDHA